MLRDLFERCFAAVYDRALESSEEAGLRDRRRALLRNATGDVLEIGAGTGANVGLYGADCKSITFLEPSKPMAAKLRKKLARSNGDGFHGPTRVLTESAEHLPLPDASVDTAVSTLVLCTVPDPDAALSELRRVLRPGGRLLFLEHVRSRDPRVARWQDRLRRPWKLFGNGCDCTRDTEAAIRRAGFILEDVEHGEVPKAPPIVRPLIQGSAVR